MHKELLSRKHVTLHLLSQEYKEKHPEGRQYSWFCHSYRDWAGQLDVVMLQEHRAGEKLFVDYTGQTIEIIDPRTGELGKVQVFVAVMGARNQANLIQSIKNILISSEDNL